MCYKAIVCACYMHYMTILYCNYYCMKLHYVHTYAIKHLPLSSLKKTILKIKCIRVLLLLVNETTFDLVPGFWGNRKQSSKTFLEIQQNCLFSSWTQPVNILSNIYKRIQNWNQILISEVGRVYCKLCGCIWTPRRMLFLGRMFLPRYLNELGFQLS